MPPPSRRTPSAPRLAANATTFDYVPLLKQVDEEQRQQYHSNQSHEIHHTTQTQSEQSKISTRQLYKQTLSDVTSLGIQKLDKWSKARVEEQKWIENGGKKHKQMKIPFNMKLGMIKKNKMRAERKRQRVSLF